MKDRYALLQQGLFPETLPPCFTSSDIKRALVGLVRELKAKTFHAKRSSDYVPYSGTKHDGSRRLFASPNPISYFYVANFIAEHWRTFEQRFAASPFSVSQPRVAPARADRPIVIPSLSELTTVASKKLRHSAFVLKADIAQFFPSIYTHAIVWSAHGVTAAKADPSPHSTRLPFNQLDFFVRNCQRAETRGVLVGPDAFRLIAEFIVAGIDAELSSELGDKIVGAARHVDDFYLGLGGEVDALVALSALREALLRFNLHINDSKTKVMSGVEPLNELWAQRLRHRAGHLYFPATDEDVVLFITEALAQSREVNSDSPVKIALRALDDEQAYQHDSTWEIVEPYLQRILHHHPHSIDYVALLAVKRSALGLKLDRDGWKGAAYALIQRHLALNHHHEVVWLTWLLFGLGIKVDERLSEALATNQNGHIRAMLVAAHREGLLQRKPSVRLGPKLSSTDSSWLVNLVARASGYTGAAFGGELASEFEHLAKKRVKLVDFKAYIKSASKASSRAISRTRYGYDQTDYAQEENENEDEDEDDLDAAFRKRIRRDNT